MPKLNSHLLKLCIDFKQTQLNILERQTHLNLILPKGFCRILENNYVCELHMGSHNYVGCINTEKKTGGIMKQDQCQSSPSSGEKDLFISQTHSFLYTDYKNLHGNFEVFDIVFGINSFQINIQLLNQLLFSSFVSFP